MTFAETSGGASRTGIHACVQKTVTCYSQSSVTNTLRVQCAVTSNTTVLTKQKFPFIEHTREGQVTRYVTCLALRI